MQRCEVFVGTGHKLQYNQLTTVLATSNAGLLHLAALNMLTSAAAEII